MFGLGDGLMNIWTLFCFVNLIGIGSVVRLGGGETSPAGPAPPGNSMKKAIINLNMGDQGAKLPEASGFLTKLCFNQGM